jgi:hypothetical protein
MEKPRDSPKIMFDLGHTASRTFIGAVAQLTTHPIIAELMRYDCFTDSCLTLELRRGSATDRVWLAFWIDRLAPACPSTQVYHLYHFVRNFAWPSPDGLSLTFGVPLCCANCPQERWEEYEKVMDGLQDASVDVLGDQYLSTFMIDPQDSGEHMKVYVLFHVRKGAPLVLDYARGYASSRGDTVLHIFKERAEMEHYIRLYDNIAKSVSRRVREHFLDYMQSRLDRARLAKRALAPPKAPVPAPAQPEPPTTYT